MPRTFKGHRPKPARITRMAARPEAEAGPVSRQPAPAQPAPARPVAAKRREIGGPSGPEPTRYGDWERRGICVDF